MPARVRLRRTRRSTPSFDVAGKTPSDLIEPGAGAVPGGHHRQLRRRGHRRPADRRRRGRPAGGAGRGRPPAGAEPAGDQGPDLPAGPGRRGAPDQSESATSAASSCCCPESARRCCRGARIEAEIGIIGGSGFYSFAEDAEPIDVSTPYGPPTGEISIGTVAGRRVAFVARHGAKHEYPPHLVNYRANLWALRSLGVRQVLAPCAVGSLVPTCPPGPSWCPTSWSTAPGAGPTPCSTRWPGSRTSPSPTPTAPGAGAVLPGGRPHARPTAARWWWSTGRASPPAPSRPGTPPRAGRWSG